jgi:hypothetical protein
MSTDPIPYPPDFDRNYHADHHEERRRLALRRLDVGDVLAEVGDRLASEPEPALHPLAELVEFLLDRRAACDGGELYDRCKALCLTAIDRCVAEALDQED